jgi:hypothetical protein
MYCASGAIYCTLVERDTLIVSLRYTLVSSSNGVIVLRASCIPARPGDLDVGRRRLQHDDGRLHHADADGTAGEDHRPQQWRARLCRDGNEGKRIFGHRLRSQEPELCVDGRSHRRARHLGRKAAGAESRARGRAESQGAGSDRRGENSRCRPRPRAGNRSCLAEPRSTAGHDRYLVLEVHGFAP